jgi:hypothetical protein
MSRWAQRNPERFNALWRRWYRKNPKRKYAWQKRRRAEIRQWFEALRATKSCECCGERTPECLQFHHRDRATKLIEVSKAVARAWRKERIRAEIAKCVVLCANCHLKHHWEERRQ